MKSQNEVIVGSSFMVMGIFPREVVSVILKMKRGWTMMFFMTISPWMTTYVWTEGLTHFMHQLAQKNRNSTVYDSFQLKTLPHPHWNQAVTDGQFIALPREALWETLHLHLRDGSPAGAIYLGVWNITLGIKERHVQSRLQIAMNGNR